MNREWTDVNHRHPGRAVSLHRPKLGVYMNDGADTGSMTAHGHGWAAVGQIGHRKYWTGHVSDGSVGVRAARPSITPLMDSH